MTAAGQAVVATPLPTALEEAAAPVPTQSTP